MVRMSIMKKLIVAVILIFVVNLQFVKADLYNGSISYPEGIFATQKWADDDTSISWEITQNTDGNWHYSYTFSVPSKEISHFILEVSGNFTSNDFLGFYNPPVLASSVMDSSGSWEALDPTTYSPDDPGNSNPGLPGSIFGIKFQGPSSTQWHFEFNSTKQPMWGDFYAKDGKDGGKEVYAYNTGFGNDLQVADGHIAVPDTYNVPAPAAVLLGIFGIAFAGIKLRKIA